MPDDNPMTVDCNELNAAGYGGYERERIPKDWRSRPRPDHWAQALSCICGRCDTCKAREKSRERAALRKAALGLHPGKTLVRRGRKKKALENEHA